MQKDYIFNFDPKKNKDLINSRNISFEEVIAALHGSDAISILTHPNKIKYPRQQIYIVEIRGYPYVIPFIKDGNEIFLKTIFPSRKAKKYLNKKVKR